MAGNSEKIDEIIDPAALKQVVDLTVAMNILEKQFIDATKAAIQLNNQTGGAKTFKDYANSASQAATETAKMQKAQLDVAKATIQLQQARQKAADDYEAKIRKEIELTDKAAEAQRKLQEAADKRASVIGPTIIGGSGDSVELTRAQAEAIGAKSRAEQLETIAAMDAANAASLKAAAEKANADSTSNSAVQEKANADAVSASQRIVNQYSGTLRDNSLRQVDLAAQLKIVQDRLKNLDNATAQSRSSKASLTAEETRLKQAIQQNSIVMKQQAKDELNAAGSADGLNARLALLRTTFNSLTEAERNNAQIGGVLLTEIKLLDEQTKNIAQSQGLYNKSVGDYENAIKKAISANVPYGAQIVKGIDALKMASTAQDTNTSALARLAFGFASFTIGAFAVAIGSAIYYLSQFQDVADRSAQKINGLKNVFSAFGQSELKGGGNILKGLANLFAGSNILNAGQPDYYTKTLGSIKKAFAGGVDIQKAVQDLEAFNEVNDAQVKQQQAQADQYRAMAKNRKTDKEDRLKYLNDAQVIEKQILAKQKTNSDLNIEIAIEVSNKVKKIDADTRKELGKGDIALANALVRSGDMTKQGYELYKTAIDRKTQAQSSATMKLIRQQNDEDNLLLKAAKGANNDQLALDKARIEQQKANAKLILDDDHQTIEARLAALALYEKKSKELIENQRVTANSAPGTSSTKKAANNVEAKTALTQIDVDVVKEKQKIYAEYYSEQERIIKGALTRRGLIEKEILKNSLDVEAQYTRQRKQDAQDSSDDQLQILADQYSKGLISAQEYQKKKKDIEGGAAINQDQIDVEGLKMRIAIAESLGEDSLNDKEKLAIAERKLSKDTAAAEIAAAEDVANRKKELRAKEKELANAGFQLIQTIVDAGYQNQLNAIQGQKDALDKQTSAQIDAENRSLDSTADKADKIAIINAKAAAQQNILDERQRAVKQKQAQADRLFAIAKIIENTAIGVTSALAEFPPNIPLAIIVGALGAVQLATTLATPIPKYQHGTDSAKGGISLVGEVGKEYVIQPDGGAYFTPSSPTLMDIPKGSKVISNMELMSIMSNPFKQRANISGNDNRKMIEAINTVGAKTVRALRNNKPKAPIILVDTMKAGKFNDYRNNHFR